MLQIASPFQQIFDTDGSPLDNGYIYIGTANANPEVSPISLWWDDAGTIPAAQPIRTQNGYIVRNGTPARVYTSLDDFSLTVKNRNGVIVLTVLDATSDSNLTTALAASSGSSLIGFLQAGTGAVARTVEGKLKDLVSPQDFDAVGDGIANDTTAWNNWLSATGSKYIPRGYYLVSGVVKYYTSGTFANTVDTNHNAGLYALEKISSGNANTAFGNLAGSSITSGSQNTAVGKSALETMQAGNNNTAVGFASLRYANNAGAVQNTCIGSFAGNAITIGNNNTALGHNCLFTLTTGIFNTALGQGALAYNVTGGYNTAAGYHALLNYTGSNGVAFGVEALTSLTTGTNNVAVGYGALKTVTTAASNTAVGHLAGNSATSAQGTYVGDSAGYAVAAGAANTLVGYNAGVAIQGGSNNTAVGAQSLISCISGARNVALGRVTLLNATGDDNTAIGTTALNACTTGVANTALGGNALSALTTFTNCTGLGFDSAVTGSNQVQLGNSSTTTYAYGAVQNRSDARDKTDIRETTLGLDFIRALRPVDFRWDYREDYGWGEKDGSKKRTRFHHGLIAQEVKASCDAAGVDFGGYQNHAASGGKDVMSLGYEELIAPLIKAVQQLAAEVEKLKVKS